MRLRTATLLLLLLPGLLLPASLSVCMCELGRILAGAGISSATPTCCAKPGGCALKACCARRKPAGPSVARVPARPTCVLVLQAARDNHARVTAPAAQALPDLPLAPLFAPTPVVTTIERDALVDAALHISPPPPDRGRVLPLLI